ncbi:Hypothetical predicted protein [Podarcis lilfordi]|uniref:Uncharacterized protein n=1 Tax=Podarcis lilfordi TaxID=74358 RepID=A0AA35K3Y7_9SAUR|nr:Hypothetical predicted protein [Podarcis lilfordi]
MANKMGEMRNKQTIRCSCLLISVSKDAGLACGSSSALSPLQTREKSSEMPIAHLLELWKKIEVEVEPMETEPAAEDASLDEGLDESTNEVIPFVMPTSLKKRNTEDA